MHVEAIRNAVKANGGKKPTGEQVKKGFELIKEFYARRPRAAARTSRRRITKAAAGCRSYQVKGGKFVKQTEWFRAYPEVVAAEIKKAE